MGEAVLVHGAWHGAWCWERVVAELERLGVATTAVELPLTGFDDDVATARAAIEAAGSGCIVVGHSYGGAVISQAAVGLPVGRLIFLAALMVEPGEPMSALMEGSSVMSSLVFEDDGLRVDPAAAPAVFYGDAAPDVAAAAVAQLRPMPLAGGGDTVTEAAWKSIPSTYIVCTNDAALPVASQRRLAARAEEAIEWPNDHSPFLTRPGDIAELIAR